MSEWLCRLLHVPQQKVSKKDLLVRVITTIGVTWLCLTIMIFTARAYFTNDLSSSSNQICTAYFDAVVTVQHADATGETVEVHSDGTFVYWAELEGGSTYYVTLRHADDSTANTGYIIVNEKYHSGQINRDEDGVSETVTFFVTPVTDQRVTFRVCWGTSIYADASREEGDLYIEADEVVALIADEVVENTTTTLPSTTTAAPTTTTTTSTSAATTTVTTTVATTTATITATTVTTTTTTVAPAPTTTTTTATTVTTIPSTTSPTVASTASASATTSTAPTESVTATEPTTTQTDAEQTTVATTTVVLDEAVITE